ncbi:unnamed protein product [Menidia menidia]|uniref:(Atlantic silverside) hypothetical protein n=1 Tax=Menidia menidia TaxID=238744 RepID=A0A8S4AZU8_9TELE|nr:unnamed protein product [Menidia menidia]
MVYGRRSGGCYAVDIGYASARRGARGCARSGGFGAKLLRNACRVTPSLLLESGDATFGVTGSSMRWSHRCLFGGFGTRDVCYCRVGSFLESVASLLHVALSPPSLRRVTWNTYLNGKDGPQSEYSTWEPEDNILDPRLVLAYEENQEKLRALAYRRKGLRPRRLLLRNVFAMDLRSAHKVMDKPPPRLRLSLTRSMSTDVEQVLRRPALRRSRQRGAKGRLTASKLLRPLRKKEQPLDEEWATSEEDKPESEGIAEERCDDGSYGWFLADVWPPGPDARRSGGLRHAPFSPKGQSECSSLPSLEQQDLDIEVEEKVDGCLIAVAAETWDDDESDGGPEAVAVEKCPNQTSACEQLRAGGWAPEARPGHAVPAGDRSVWGGGESLRAESQRSNTASVIVRVQGGVRASGAVCPPSEPAEERGDNQRVSVTSGGAPAAPDAADRPEKVIVTHVTLNSLTVTFKEAPVAKGFFKGY